MKTKVMLKLALVAAAICAVNLAPKAVAITTNLVQKVGFDLVFYEQGPTNVATNGTTTIKVDHLRVNTKDIIAALGSATSNKFSTSAKLVLVTPVGTTNGSPAFEVQDGTNYVNVSSYFTTSSSSLAVTGTLLKGHDEDDWFEDDFSGAKVTGTITYDILYLTLKGSNLKATLNVDGFDTTVSTMLATTNGLSLDINESSARVSGTGTDANGTPAVVKGDISIRGHNLVVH